MKHASLVGGGLVKNNIFDLTSAANRDNCFDPYAALRSRFLLCGIDLSTSDMNDGKAIAFELHQNVQRGGLNVPAYLMLFETSIVRPANASVDAYARYRKIFTWNDELVDGQRFIKLNFPNPLTVPRVDGYAERDRLCCLIAANKSVKKYDPREMYSERVRTIRWFEKHAPTDFDLYGIDWDLPPGRRDLLGKIKKGLFRYVSPTFGRTPFPSYRGKINRKRDVLQRTRFSICYENVRDIPGYITEKIFDCFFAGCVPVYWGANNVVDHIPAACFVDRRDFKNDAYLYVYLQAMNENTYLGYQQSIATFLAGDAVRPFGSEAFSETIVSTILEDMQHTVRDFPSPAQGDFD